MVLLGRAEATRRIVATVSLIALGDTVVHICKRSCLLVGSSLMSPEAAWPLGARGC